MKSSFNIAGERKEGGYGWVIVLAAFVVLFIIDGMMYSFGIVLIELLEVFHETRARTAAVGSVMVGVTHLTGPVAAYLANRYSCRAIVIVGSLISTTGLILSVFVPDLPYLYVTYGFITGPVAAYLVDRYGFRAVVIVGSLIFTTGVGSGLMMLSVNVCVMQHFTSRKSLATGLAVCGSGVGVLAYTHMTRYLLDNYGLKGTYLLLAGISLHGVACGLLLITPNQLRNCSAKGNKSYVIESQTKNIYTISMRHTATKDPEYDTYSECDKVSEHRNDNNGNHKEEIDTIAIEYETKAISTKYLCRNICNLTLLRNTDCLVFLLCIFLVNLAFTIPFSFLPDQVLEIGMGDIDASWLVFTIGLANIVGKAIIGWIGDKRRVNSFVMFESLLVLAGISTSVSPLLSTFYTKLIYTCLYGFLIGGYITMASIVQIDTFGSKLFSQSFGLSMFAIGLSSTAAASLGGWLFDWTGSYDITFVVAGCELILGAFVLLLPKMISLCRHTRR